MNAVERGVLYVNTHASDVDDSRVVQFVGTTGIRDRYGDEIPLDGWDFTNYLKNPVVLFGHDYRSLPIGRTLKIERKRVNGKLAWVFDVEFADKELNPLADQVFKLVKRGFLRSVSVGFRSLHSQEIEETEKERKEREEETPDVKPGKVFKKKELLELSIVPVPANPEALLVETKKGLEVPETVRSFLEEFEKEMERIDDSQEAIEKTKAIKAKIEAQIKGAIPYSVHGDCPKAPEGESWNAGKEVMKATGDARKLRRMHAWVDSENPNFDANERQWYKLPHHKGDGQQPVVWRGVAAAMAALLGARGGVQIPEKDRKGVYNHLVRHYKQFDKVPPELRDLEEEIILRPGWEDNPAWTEIRYRIRNPKDFEQDSFRRITLKKNKPRIYAIVGRLKGEESLTLQSLRFPKDDGWTLEAAKEWVKEHPDVLKEFSRILIEFYVTAADIDSLDFCGIIPGIEDELADATYYPEPESEEAGEEMPAASESEKDRKEQDGENERIIFRVKF